MTTAAGPSMDVNYDALARFRYELRSFLAFSEAAATKAGLTAHQYQALVAIKGFSRNGPVSVGDLAALMFVRHHTAVSLVNRTARLGLLMRTRDPEDQRRVLVTLTELGEERLRSLATVHVEELRRAGPTLSTMLQAVTKPPE